ncbi:unnamed protein product [Darwinula stevensoni]|uniref:Uncharacterized protein n=1 Tax=Darwinula stevensoni TaxID=69355 RepID=A0A7R8X2L5_9CRUS|nr:unnamed protein product [Darwinula stevensoni]CAG0883556.1 unnamed protein product [Darwinula stevensoni]
MCSELLASVCRAFVDNALTYPSPFHRKARLFMMAFVMYYTSKRAVILPMMAADWVGLGSSIADLMAPKGTRTIPEFLKIHSRQGDIPALLLVESCGFPCECRGRRSETKKEIGLLEEGRDRDEGQMRLFGGRDRDLVVGNSLRWWPWPFQAIAGPVMYLV